MDTATDLTKLTPAQLNDWYEENVGYRPQVDDPSMSDAALLDTCVSYQDARPLVAGLIYFGDQEMTQ